MIGKIIAFLTLGSLIGMFILEGHVQKSFMALHTFMSVFTTLLLTVYVDFDS